MRAAAAPRHPATREVRSDVAAILDRSRRVVADNASLRTRLAAARDEAARLRALAIGGCGACFVAGLAVGHWAFGS